MLLMSAEPVLPKASARTGGRPGLVNENPDHVRPAYCQTGLSEGGCPCERLEQRNSKRKEETEDRVASFERKTAPVRNLHRGP